MLLPPLTDALVLDDADLMRDRLLRSLHRNSDGHLAACARRHADQVSPTHNIAVLYVYMQHEANAHSMHEQYIFSHDPRSYRDWWQLVNSECFRLHRADRTVLGVYGWLTSFMRITPLRTGDLFVKIDRSGATGVRISFSAAKTKRETQSKKTAATH